MGRLSNLYLLIFVILSLISGPSWAVLMGATSAPKQAKVSVDDGRTIHIRWTISSSPAHSSGVYSAQATLKDSATDTVLKTIENPLNLAEGAGPFQFEETLTLSPDEVKQWYDLGYQKLVLKRAFTTDGNNSTSSEASLWLSVVNKQSNGSVAPSNNLVIHSVGLRFKPQRFKRQVIRNVPLQAQLEVLYSGQGKLNALWQIAELGNDDIPVAYKTLAQANKTLKHQQQGFLISPKLPTAKVGRYVLRLCANDHNLVTNSIAATQNQCANPELSSNLQYEVVTANTEADENPDIQTLAANAIFNWQPVEGVVVYELQLQQSNGKSTLESGQYLARMLLAYDKTSAPLTNDIVELMHPGTQYQWQVSALNQHGELIQQTAPLFFVFMP